MNLYGFRPWGRQQKAGTVWVLFLPFFSKRAAHVALAGSSPTLGASYANMRSH